MSGKYNRVIETIFSKSVEDLVRSNRKPPNKEALRLYREVIKFCGEFDWENEKGELWRDTLRKSARQEFENSREEDDPVNLYKMMVTTKDAMRHTKDMV